MITQKYFVCCALELKFSTIFVLRAAAATYRSPVLLHLLEGLLEGELLAGRFTDHLKLGDVVLKIHVDELRKAHILVRRQRVTHDVRDLLPMPLPQAGIEEGLDEGHVMLEIFHLRLQL